MDGKKSFVKRKFVPNIAKALAKKSQAGTSASNEKNCQPRESSKAPNPKRPRINRKALEDDKPRFVQGYSLFESGIGCAERSNNSRFERDSYASTSGKASGRFANEPEISTVSQDFVNDIPTSNVCQVFKYPPNKMPPDPPEKSSQFEAANEVESRSHILELFDESKSEGSLFALRLPEALLYQDSPLTKSGKFGKIQLLDNGEVRLVIGDCFFRLSSPGPAPYSTDVVLVEEDENDGVVNLTSLGHIEQFITAVPDLDHFAQLGR